MSITMYKELKFTTEKCLKQNGLSFAFLSGSSISYSYIKPPAHLQQFTDHILLKLHRPAILQKIVFLQQNIETNCNVKSFQIFAGMTEDSCEMLLEGHLRSEFEIEEFSLRNKINGVYMPTLFIKICPLQYWESCSRFNVTNVKLFGLEDDGLVTEGLNSHRQYQHRLAARLCLKFLRDSGHLEAFEVVSRSLGVDMEHVLASEIYHNLLKLGDYKKVEHLLEQAFDLGLGNEYMATQPCFSKWREIQQVAPESDWPASRGGHQVCIDSTNDVIFLFGGWNGLSDLGDFWKFDLKTELWTLISSDTSIQGGPTQRSCHKMCIDLKQQKLYTIGKYLDHNKRVVENLKSDFYSYDIRSNEWTLLSSDTFVEGGPPLVFDHQVVVDDDRSIIFVFGGNTFFSSIESEERPSIAQHVSTLYAYDISTNYWIHVRKNDTILSSRIGHSLLYSQPLKYLFIFAGQWNKINFSDLQVYDTTHLDDVTHLDHLAIRDFLPASLVGFTHRSILDTDLNEIHVLTGISKELSIDKNRDVKQNTLWIYDILRGTWQCIDKEIDIRRQDVPRPLLPAPRFAHQFVYNPVKKVHYLFGGNPNKDSGSETRLNDLWSLEVCRMDRFKLSGDMRYQVRKSCYKEMIHLDPSDALRYLQNDLYSSLDLADFQRLAEFETLPSLLFKSHVLDEQRGASGEISSASKEEEESSDEIRSIRAELFEIVLKYFPEDGRQPGMDIVDLIPRRNWDPICPLSHKM